MHYIRMKFDGTNLAHLAWNRNLIGIWYGAWSAAQWNAWADMTDPQKLDRLTAACREQDLPWTREEPFPSTYLQTIRRFCNIPANDWVFTCFGNAIHKARIGAPELQDVRELERDREIFKARELLDLTSFPFAELPSAFRMLATTGQQHTVSNPAAFQRHFQILADCNSAPEAARHYRELATNSTAEWLELLSNQEWESLCTDFLIVEKQFVLTGLLVGGTLPGLDIVGASARDGQKIFAQCKKNAQEQPADENFLAALPGIPPGASIYYFAFGGCHDGRLGQAGVAVVDRPAIIEWLHTERGRGVLALFTGTAAT